MTTMIEAVCTACGTVFRRQPAFLRRRRTLFCSRACAKAGLRGPANPRWRGQAVQRDTGRWRARHLFDPRPCEACGATPDEVRVQRHHVDQNPLNNAPDNIRFLCPADHARLHAALKKQESAS